MWGRAATARRGQPTGTCARVPWVAPGGWRRASCSGGRWYWGQTQCHAWRRSLEPSVCLRSCHGRLSPLMDICHGHLLCPQDHPTHPMATPCFLLMAPHSYGHPFLLTTTPHTPWPPFSPQDHPSYPMATPYLLRTTPHTPWPPFSPHSCPSHPTATPNPSWLPLAPRSNLHLTTTPHTSWQPLSLHGCPSDPTVTLSPHDHPSNPFATPNPS